MATSRSVAELLPRPFDELTLEDVAAILAGAEDRETLYLERKRSVSNHALAKACAAFANTRGGLLVVGVSDDSDALVGFEQPAGEVQVWVKDILRAHVVPMPPFRARWLEVDAANGLLLVLVEESSTTPHLLGGSGVIYVRNPGSSDPRPIADQGLLLDLTRRGREARQSAQENAERLAARGTTGRMARRLILAATGLRADPLDIWYAADPALTRLVGIARGIVGGREGGVWTPKWTQDEAQVAIEWQRHPVGPPAPLVQLLLQSTGVVSVLEAESATSDRGSSFEFADLLEWIPRALNIGRDVLLEAGAHGDVRYVYTAEISGRSIFYARDEAQALEFTLPVRGWTGLAADERQDTAVTERVRLAMLRALGVRNPPTPTD